MTAIGVFSIVLSLAALAAFFMGGLMFTILLVQEAELSERRRGSGQKPGSGTPNRVHASLARVRELGLVQHGKSPCLKCSPFGQGQRTEGEN